MNRTFVAKNSELDKKFYLIDAKDQILGRVAAKAASILRGKHKPTFTPYIDTGDSVIIINAEKIRVTGKKLTDKIYQRYSGYPSGQRQVTLGDLLKKAPAQVMRLAVNRMLPRGPMGYHLKTKLRVYKGDQHPHQSQKPISLSI